MEKVADIVAVYRKKDIVGQIINLSPVNEDDLSGIVRMRNDHKMMYYFNQSMEITLEGQKEWYYKYLQRNDDLYWAIKDKNETLIGAIRLYDILPDRCEQGSCMIDSKYSRTAPFAVEAIMLSIDFAFDILGVKTIVNENRYDNKNMNSLSRRFGFKKVNEVNIRDIMYNYYELTKSTYKKDDIVEVLNLWMSR